LDPKELERKREHTSTNKNGLNMFLLTEL